MPSDSSPTYTQLPTMNMGQLGVLNSLAGQVQSQIGAGVSPYPGQMTSGPSDIQSQLFDYTKNVLKGEGWLQPEMRAGLSSVMTPWDPTQAKQYWEDMIMPAANLQFQKGIPNLMENFAAVDAAGGGMARKGLGDTYGDFMTNMGSVLANTLLQDKSQSNQALLSAAGLAKSIPYDAANLAGTVGTQQRGITNEQLQEGFQKWYMNQPWANPWLQYANPVMSARPFENIVQPGTQSGWPGMLGGAGQALGGVAALAKLFL